RRYEIHDGELSGTPAPNPRHQRLVGAIYRILFAYVRSGGLGEVLLSPIDVIRCRVEPRDRGYAHPRRRDPVPLDRRHRPSAQAPALRALRGALLLDRGRGGALGRGTRARARGVRAGRTGRRRGTGGAAAARRSGARRGGSLARGSGGRLDLRTLAVGRAHVGLDPAAHVEVPGHLDPARLGGCRVVGVYLDCLNLLVESHVTI